jgi:catechol 2,3-dioxygenase-like lactoylglutathione lyase family enzyme|tara:strand:- start:135 stop:563 length:429 start_codon:yes stop_codon:yes gene_type:complete
MIKKYRHTGLIVNNLSKSRKFYCDLLNLKIIQNFIEEGDYFNKLIKEKKLKAKVIKAISPDHVYVELIEFINAKKNKIQKPKRFYNVGAMHLCFTVKKIDNLYKKLKRNKVKFLSPPLKSDFDPVKTCFCYDPDFNLVQFVE